MISVVKDLVFVDGTTKEYVNNETGETRTRCKASFVQRGAEPFNISVAPHILETLNEFDKCDLVVEVFTLDRKWFVRAIDFADAS